MTATMTTRSTRKPHGRKNAKVLALQKHVTGAIERGEKEAIVEQATSAKDEAASRRKNLVTAKASKATKIVDVLNLPTAKKEPALCLCCGAPTSSHKSRFLPGHDARYHSWAKKVARGEMDCDETMEKLPHQDSRDLFAKHVEHERKAITKTAKK